MKNIAIRLLLSMLLLVCTAVSQAQSNNQATVLLQEVKTELQDGNLSQALQTAQQLQSKAPNDYRSHYYLSLALLGLQRYGEAQTAAQHSLRIAPDNARISVQNLVNEIQKQSQGGNLQAQAEQAAQEGLNAKAARLFDQAWRASPQRTELGLRAAVLYQDTLNQPIDAGRILWQVARAQPSTTAGKTARDRLSALQPTLNSQASAWIIEAGKQEPGQAFQTLAKAQAIAPEMNRIVQAKAEIAAAAELEDVLREAIQELSRLDLASLDTMSRLPNITKLLDSPTFAQYIAEKFGDTAPSQIKDNIKRREELKAAALAKFEQDVAAAKKAEAKQQSDLNQCVAQAISCNKWCEKEHQGWFSGYSEVVACQRGCGWERCDRIEKRVIPSPMPPDLSKL